MQMIEIGSNIKNYSVRFLEDNAYIDRLAHLGSKMFVIDHNVWDLYRDRCFAQLDLNEVFILPVEEERKNLEGVLGIYDALMARAAKRNMTLISIGGGITQDVTGFAASTLYRGINWIFLPTTLLAQADSCIGSKTSLNYRGYKNLIGTFYPPTEIYIDPNFLSTLSRQDFYSGVGEVVKLHLMGGAPSFDQMRNTMPAIEKREPVTLLNAVRKSLEIKLSYISGDEFDTGRRNLLNFGHCFGHALESTSDFEIPHGQAVLIGILFANIIAKKRRLLSDETFHLVNKAVVLPAIVAKPTATQLETNKIEAAMKMDKKRVGDGLVLILMADGYKMLKISDLSPRELADGIDELRSVLNIQ